MNRVFWWIHCSFSLGDTVPSVWLGPLLITWWRPYGGHKRDVERGVVSRWYWPKDVSIQYYPFGD